MKRLKGVRKHLEKSIMMLSMARMTPNYCRIKDATNFALIRVNSVIQTTNGAAIFINILPKNRNL
ncbi:MAG: hypothetical protein PWR04_951 [Anaerophaga sp.]|nr:hypothetical protein [Anaerophaga sp.]